MARAAAVPSWSHSPGKGLSLRFKRPPQGWEPGLLLSNVTFCGAAVAVRGTGRMFAAENNSGGVADAKTRESEGPGETGMG